MAAGENEHFSITEPREMGRGNRYALWLTATEPRYFDLVRDMRCVAAVSEPVNNRALVEISNDHDPDEAWHWIRTELEVESRVVKLDKIWEDALWLL
jgi:hypothetical protein